MHTFVIPMAGLSRRFTEAGFDKPKFMLPAFESYLFDFAVSSFQEYFAKAKFLFIIRDDQGIKNFVTERCVMLGLADFEIVSLEKETRGQAETVALGLRRAEIRESLPITIFNIDTYRKNFDFPQDNQDGYLEVFRGKGNHWSFAETNQDSDIVIRTVEKERISELCSNGLYGFRSADYFLNLFDAYEVVYAAASELYIAPMYNLAIERGDTIRAREIGIDAHEFFGMPQEYFLFLASAPSRQHCPVGEDKGRKFGAKAADITSFESLHDQLAALFVGDDKVSTVQASLLIRLADLLFRLRRSEEAEYVYIFLEKLTGKTPALIYRRGRSRLARGFFKHAASDFADVLEMKNNHPDALMFLATALVRAGERGKAIEALRRAKRGALTPAMHLYLTELLVSEGFGGLAANNDADWTELRKEPENVAAHLKVLASRGFATARLNTLAKALEERVELRKIDLLHGIALARSLGRKDLSQRFIQAYRPAQSDKILVESPAISPARNNKLKIALCLSGQLRGFEDAANSIKKYICDAYDAQVFVSCWDMRGFKNTGFQTAQRLLPSHLAGLFPEQHLGQKFSLRFPKAVSVLDKLASTPISTEEVSDIYPGAIVKLSSETEFEATYFTPDLLEEFKGLKHLLSQFKMFRQLNLCNDLRKAYENDNAMSFDAVIRLRPDFKIGADMVEIPDEFGTDVFVDILHPNEGVGDQFAISSGRNMDIYSSVWEKALLSTEPSGKSYFPRNSSVRSHIFLYDVLWSNGLAPRLAVRGKSNGVVPNLPPIASFGAALLEDFASFHRLNGEERVFMVALAKSVDETGKQSNA